MNNSPHLDELTPRESAEAQLSLHSVEPMAVLRYLSKGRLLVLGGGRSIEAIIDRLPAMPETYVASPDAFSPALARRLGERGFQGLDNVVELSVQGWMGHFRVTGRWRGETLCLATCLGLVEQSFDLILDLFEPSLSPPTTVPIGYFAAGTPNGEQLEPILTELPVCVGELIKPQYVRFESENCIHHHADTTPCQLCLRVCDAWAITSIDRAIQLNPYLCQGCGECATVCPTSAFQFSYPTIEEACFRIGLLIGVYLDRGGKTPVLLLHDRTRGRDWFEANRETIPINVLPYEVEALGSTGMDLWLMALTQGASQVLILDNGDPDGPYRQVIHSQVRTARTLLGGLGYPEGLVRLLDAQEMLSTLPHLRPPHGIRPMRKGFEAHDKRTLIRAAVQHLQLEAKRVHSVSLPEGSFFGAIDVAQEACTLCLDCVAVCPESALGKPVEGLGLAFIEARCVQCGACVRTCPEQAISLKPRFLFDTALANKPALLKQGSPIGP